LNIINYKYDIGNQRSRITKNENFYEDLTYLRFWDYIEPPWSSG